MLDKPPICSSTAHGADRPVASGQRLAGLFVAADRSLLILGAPGGGKTITLLQLLDELLNQARTDSTAPIPLLLTSLLLVVMRKPTTPI